MDAVKEMTFSDLLYKVDAMLETAIYNYEVEVMTESANEDPEKKASKLEALKKVFVTAIKKIWEAILNLIDTIIAKFDQYIRNKNVPIEAGHDITIYPQVKEFDGKLYDAFVKVTAKGVTEEDVKAAEEVLKGYNKETAYKAGDEISVADLIKIRRNLNKWKNFAAKAHKAEAYVANVIANGGDIASDVKTVIGRFASLTSSVLKDAQTIIGMGNTAAALAAQDDKNKKQEAREAKRAAKDMADGGAQNESSTEIASKLLGIASALLEGADDIYEENSVKGDEYPADDITGGEGQKPTQEEVKDLVGDDKEALAILADDEGSTTVHESIVIKF